MLDALLYFSKAQEIARVGAGAVASEIVLKASDIAQLGRGHQKFIEVWTDGNFTDEDYLLDIVLMVGAASPGDVPLMEVAHAIDGDGATPPGLIMSTVAGVGGMIAKVPLPSLNLDDFISLSYVTTATITAGGHLTAFISPDMMG